MKIEKLTENKIRIIINQNEFKNQNINLHNFLFKNIESQDLFLKILSKAKKEVDFDVEGCKLLIETFSSSDDILVFTITKYMETDVENSKSFSRKKILSVKKKFINTNDDFKIFEFESFDDFCDLCEIISKSNIILKNICKNNSLYFYNNTYYLLIENLNILNPHFTSFSNYLLEFSISLPYSKNFGVKLKEHGKVVIKKNAINVGIKNFIH